ncbi:hypothetical protein [Phytohabitans suffuscus]|uniref:Integral membrane protein n=1 Tax=Phytohabitans suffuscus TaxID=624315 RepID=A0A6F8YZE2_9ACTN|nr:hypothetical protein [Phytohabitans suffuscus]BCB91507.1 hypothetical protein Psuf_088200 [Phytohabitans suffuscus]
MTAREEPRWPAPPEPYGAFTAVDSLGGVAAPLLAGFAVALIGLLVPGADSLRHPDAALLLLALAAVLFLQVVQLNARARGYAVSPAQVREWYPDFDDPARQAVVAWELRHHRDCWAHLVRRTRVRYNIAILALTAGLMVALVPRGPVAPLRVAAIVVLGLFALLELLELADRTLGTRRVPRLVRRAVHAAAPADPPVPRPPFQPPAP